MILPDKWLEGPPPDDGMWWAWNEKDGWACGLFLNKDKYTHHYPIPSPPEYPPGRTVEWDEVFAVISSIGMDEDCCGEERYMEGRTDMLIEVRKRLSEKRGGNG